MPSLWLPSVTEVKAFQEEVARRSQDTDDPIAAGVLQKSVLESAVWQARSGPWDEDPDLALRVAYLLRGMIQEHPFVDGNKRVGLYVAVVCFERNGYALQAGDEDAVAWLLAIARGEVEVSEIATWLRRHTKRTKQEEE